MPFNNWINSNSTPGNWGSGTWQNAVLSGINPTLGLLANRDWGVTEILGGKTGSLGNNTNDSGYFSLYRNAGDYYADQGIFPSSSGASVDLNAPPASNNRDYSEDVAGINTKTSDDISNQKSTNPTKITNQFDVNGVTLSVTDTGDVLGLSDLKNTPGYLAYKEKYGGTGSDYLEYLQSGQGEIDDNIDKYYDANTSFLDQLEQSVMGSRDDFLNTFTAPYDAMLPLIQQAYQEGQGAIDSAKTAATQQGQTALDAARNLFNELNQRNRQAFGGVSSVGQAASELLGRSMQQQYGSIQQNTANTVNELVNKGINLKQEVDAKIQSLEMQKEQALSQARLALQEKIDDINRMRFQVQQDKAAAKLAALQEYNATIQSVQMQYRQFAQNLEAMKQQADLDLRNALSVANQAAGGYGAQSVDAVRNLGANLGAGLNSAAQSNALAAQDSNAGNLLNNIYGLSPINQVSSFVGNLLSGRDDDEDQLV